MAKCGPGQLPYHPTGYDIEYPGHHFHPEDHIPGFGYELHRIRPATQLQSGEETEDMRYVVGDDGQTYYIGEQYAIGAGANLPMLRPGFGGGMAPMMRPVPQQYAPPQAIPVIPMKPMVRVEKKDPTESRLQPVGCNVVTDIAVGAQATATARPQKIYKPERFTVPDSVAPSFLINGIFVGVDPQFPALGAIGAESFLPNSIYSNVDFDTCQISQDLSVQAQNRGGAPQPFFSTFFGRTLQ